MQLETGRRLPFWAFILPAALAFSLFLVYFFQIRQEPFARHLTVNPFVYDLEARQILDGEPRGRAFMMSPLYPGFVALVYGLARPDHLLVPIAQGVLLAVNTLLLGLVSRRLLGRVPGLIASFAMAFYWSFYYFAGEMVPVTLLLTFMFLAVLLFLERDGKIQTACITAGISFAAVVFIMCGLPGLKNPGGGGDYVAGFLLVTVFIAGSAGLFAAVLAGPGLRRLTNLAAAGLLLGVACLVWGGAIVLTLPLVLVLLVEALGTSAARSRRLTGVGMFMLGLCVPLAASFSHNHSAGGGRVLITSSFGVNLFIGNNPASDGMDPFRLGEGNRVRQEADRRRLNDARRSDFFAGRAYEYMRGDTRGWLSLLGKKVLLSLSRVQIDNNADISERRGAWERFYLPRLHFGIIFPLALAGLVSVFRKRGDSAIPFWGFICFTAVCIVFFVCERFRVPGIALLLPLAVSGALLVARGFRSWSRGAALAMLLLLGGAVLSNIDFLAVSDYEFPSIIVNRAHVERLEGNLDKARQLAHLAMSLEPGNAGALFQLGALEEAGGDRVAAVEYYLEAIERDPYQAAPCSGARRVLEEAGVNTAYLDRYGQLILQGQTADELKEQIIGFVEQRTVE
jgi:tetratricopeptide (TPR) repeat protein